MQNTIIAPANKVVLELVESSKTTKEGFLLPETSLNSEIAIGKLQNVKPNSHASKQNFYFKKNDATLVKVKESIYYVLKEDDILLIEIL